jgi:methylated-DNA-[protein]-cysteine S-methyltransferase
MTAPFGALRLGAADDAVTLIEFHPARAEGEMRVNALLRRAERQLREYFAGERQEFELPLAPEGTEFQQRVWQALTKIPFGQVQSYGEIARAVRRPDAARAVGLACGTNPLPIVIPCHRVVGAKGQLTGFGGGLPVKEWLLTHEGIALV